MAHRTQGNTFYQCIIEDIVNGADKQPDEAMHGEEYAERTQASMPYPALPHVHQPGSSANPVLLKCYGGFII